MKMSPRSILIFLALQTCYCTAGGSSSYYREFVNASSGKRTPFQIKSPVLVNTNNCSPAARGKPVALIPGTLVGVKLGMSMDEVVALWGKPVAIGCCREGRPCFTFEDTYVYFKENEVSEVGLNVWMPFTPNFAGGLVPVSRVAEWVRLLGSPSSQNTNAFGLSLCYETNRTVMTLRFDSEDKRLSQVTLSPAARAESPSRTQDQR